MRKTNNSFWLDTFNSWETLNSKVSISSNVQISSSPIWYNKKLNEDYLNYPVWYEKGIIIISDILDKEGNILAMNDLKERYNLDSVNFLDYLRLSRVVKGFTKNTVLVFFRKLMAHLCPIAFGY